MILNNLGNFGLEYDPFAPLRRLQQEMSRLFEDAGTDEAYAFPPINLWLSQNEAHLSAELPGLDPSSIDINVIGNTLSLKGARKESEPTSGRFFRRERGHGDFARVIELPFPVNADAVEAKYEKGILDIRLPRAEADKPRKIALK